MNIRGRSTIVSPALLLWWRGLLRLEGLALMRHVVSRRARIHRLVRGLGVSTGIPVDTDILSASAAGVAPRRTCIGSVRRCRSDSPRGQGRPAGPGRDGGLGLGLPALVLSLPFAFLHGLQGVSLLPAAPQPVLVVLGARLTGRSVFQRPQLRLVGALALVHTVHALEVPLEFAVGLENDVEMRDVERDDGVGIYYRRVAVALGLELGSNLN